MARSAEIMLETKEVVVLRLRGTLLNGWCERCGGHVEVLRATVSPRARARAVESLATRFHVIECPDGELLICLTKE